MSTIKSVTVDKLAEVMEIYKAATRKMDEMNIFQWDDDYPDQETIEKDIKDQTMYGYFEGDEICAVGVLNESISKQMIRFSEEYAEKHQYKTIRFDAYMKNPISTGVYKKAGYIVSGTVTFRKGDFYCFEMKTSHYDNIKSVHRS